MAEGPALPDDEPQPVAVPVTVIHPRKGAMERLTTQPGSVHAFESVQLYAGVSGFLKTQNFLIGARVKKGQVLAVVDVPDLEKKAERDQAAVDQAKSKVDQMTARVLSARAEADAAEAAVKQAEASAKSAAAWLRYRQKQLVRYQELFALKSIDERLVDEKKEQYEASVETEQAALAAITTTKAKLVASNAKIQQAQADVEAAQSEVAVARADLARINVLVSYATVTAPFDGVITYRSMFPGDYVRAANEGGAVPLYTVQRTDVMTVVVMVPDRDVVYTDVGDLATLELDALPGMKFSGKISRLAESQDPQTRLMRVEIDIPNTTGKIKNGMYGRVTIVLDKAADTLSIPTSCLASKSQNGATGTVYVIRGGHAHPVSVNLGQDNGVRVTIAAGLNASDDVVLHPGNALADGAQVTSTFWDEAPIAQ